MPPPTFPLPHSLSHFFPSVVCISASLVFSAPLLFPLSHHFHASLVSSSSSSCLSSSSSSSSCPCSTLSSNSSSPSPFSFEKSFSVEAPLSLENWTVEPGGRAATAATAAAAYVCVRVSYYLI